MRYLGSLLLALLVAPLGFVLTGRGLGGLAEVAAAAPTADRTDYFAIVTSAAALGLAGLMFALLTMARLAPPGPALAGAGYLGVGVWALVDRDHLQAVLPAERFGLAPEELTLAATVAPLLAVPLLLTFFLPRRWQRRDRAPVPPHAYPPPQPSPPPPWPAPPSPPPPPVVPAPPPVRVSLPVTLPIPLRPPAPPPSPSVDETTTVLHAEPPTDVLPSDETTTRLGPAGSTRGSPDPPGRPG